MGLLVHSGTMQNGITLSNVYISFNDFPIQIFPKGQAGLPQDTYELKGIYKVFRDGRLTEIQEEISVKTSDVNRPAHLILYEALVELFPDSINIL